MQIATEHRRQQTLELLPPVRGMNNILPADMIDKYTATEVNGSIDDFKILPVLSEVDTNKSNIIHIDKLQNKLVIFYQNGEVHDLNGRLFSYGQEVSTLTCIEYGGSIVAMVNGILYENSTNIYSAPYFKNIGNVEHSSNELGNFTGDDKFCHISNGLKYFYDKGTTETSFSVLYPKTMAIFENSVYNAYPLYNNGQNTYQVRVYKNNALFTDYEQTSGIYLCHNRIVSNKTLISFKDKDNRIKSAIFYYLGLMQDENTQLKDTEVLVGRSDDNEYFVCDANNIYIYKSGSLIRTIQKKFADKYSYNNTSSDCNSVLNMYKLENTYIVIYGEYVEASGYAGSVYYEVENTYISIDFNTPSKTDKKITGSYLYNKVLYLLYYDGEIRTLSLNGFNGEIGVKSGRLHIGFEDKLIFSAIGDISKWSENSSIDSEPKQIEIGYKEAGEITHIKYINDILIYKSNGYWYRLSNDYPNWVLNRICESPAPISNIVSIGTNLLYGTNDGIKQLITSHTYGDYIVEDMQTSIQIGKCKYICISETRKSILFVIDNNDDKSGIYEYKKNLNSWTKISAFIPDKLIEVGSILYALKDNLLYTLDLTNTYNYQYGRLMQADKFIIKSVTLYASGKGTVVLDIGNGKKYTFNIDEYFIKQKQNQIATTTILQPKIEVTGENIIVSKILIDYAIIGDK